MVSLNFQTSGMNKTVSCLMEGITNGSMITRNQLKIIIIMAVDISLCLKKCTILMFKIIERC